MWAMRLGEKGKEDRDTIKKEYKGNGKGTRRRQETSGKQKKNECIIISICFVKVKVQNWKKGKMEERKTKQTRRKRVTEREDLRRKRGSRFADENGSRKH